jgi:Flp pilus assembly protein TadG
MSGEEVRKPQSGQSMVEFALVVGAFLLVTFAAVSAAFHSVQRAMAETAAAAGVQIAASGSPGDPSAPDLAGAYQPTADLLRSVLFGTAITPGPAGRPCPQTVPDGTLEVCVYPDGNLVAETVRGHPAFPIPWITRYLPWGIDVTVEMHRVSYQP